MPKTDMKDEGVSLSKLERWEKQQKEHMRFLEDQARNDKKMLDWRILKTVNAGLSFAFTAGLFLLIWAIKVGLDWMIVNYTQAQINDFGKGLLFALAFTMAWSFVWHITNPARPHIYFRNPETKKWSDLDD